MTNKLSRCVVLPDLYKKSRILYCFSCAARYVFGIVSRCMLGCGVLFVALSSQASDETVRVNMPLMVEDAVAQALSANTTLALRRERAQAMTYQVAPAGALPDPRLSVNLANLPTDDPGFGNDPMTQIQIGLAQDLPFPGKRRLRRDAMAFDAQAEAIGADEFQSQLVRDVKLHWWQLFYIDRALETVARNHELMRQLVATAQSQYAVGRGLQQDVLLAQLELSRLLDEEIMLTESRRLSEAALATLLDWPVDSRIELPPSGDTALPDVPAETVLVATAMEERSELRKVQTDIDAAESRRDLAQRELYPDFRVAAVYGQREDRSDLASLQFSMSLPLYAGSKQKQIVDQRDAELIVARTALSDSRARVASEVAQALARYHRARDGMALYESGIIPQAKQTVDSMLAGYQVGKVDFTQLVRTQTTLYQYQKQFWLAFSTANQALARLEAAVGREFISSSSE